MNELNEFLQPAARVKRAKQIGCKINVKLKSFCQVGKKNQWGRWDFEMNNNDMMIRAGYRESTHDSPGISWGEIGNCWSLLVPYVSIHQWQAGKNNETRWTRSFSYGRRKMWLIIGHSLFDMWYIVISFSSELEPFFFRRDFGGTRRGTLLGTKISHQKSQKKDDFPNFPRWDMWSFPGGYCPP